MCSSITSFFYIMRFHHSRFLARTSRHGSAGSANSLRGAADSGAATGVAVPEAGADPGGGMSPSGSLRYSTRNFRQGVLDGTKCPVLLLLINLSLSVFRRQ
jgi:hypothetical protein